MAIDFPNTPALNDIFTVGNRSWVYTATGWAAATVNVINSNYLPLGGGTLSDTLITATPSTTIVPIRIPHGSAPTTPTNGDVWTTTAGMYVRVNGVTVGPLAAAGLAVPATLSGSSASPILKITQTGAGDALLVEDSASTDTTPFAVNANGQVLVGRATALDTSSKVEVFEAAGPAIRIAGGALSGLPGIEFQRSNGSPDTPTNVTTSSILGQISMRPYAGGYVQGPEFKFTADGVVAGTRVDGGIEFWSTNALSGGSTEKVFGLSSLGILSGTRGSLGAWTSYTPTITGFTLGNGTRASSYCQIGKTVHFKILLTFGSTSTAALANPTFTLPVTAKSTQFNGVCSAVAWDASAFLRFSVEAHITSTTVLTVYPHAGTNGATGLENLTFSTTSPFTWAISDSIYIAGTYEAA